jgi:hypothetical protein
MIDFHTAYRSEQPAMVRFTGIVTGNPRFFHASRSRYDHESFPVRTADGPVEIVENVSLAPRIPVRAGDRVEVQGEMVHDPGRIPCVHFVHHDPEGTHPDGYVRIGNRIYA